MSITKTNFIFTVTLWTGLLGTQSWGEEPNATEHRDIDAAGLFSENCALCHARPGPWPDINGIAKLTSEEIYRVMSGGLMRELAAGLNDAEQQAVAAFIGNLNPNKPSLDSGGLCSEIEKPAAKRLQASGSWEGWSPDPGNSRYVRDVTLTEKQIKGLKLKWAFVFPDTAPTTSAGAQPTIADGRVYIGNMNGMVYALDAESGCTYWSFRAKTHVRSSVVISGDTLLVADYETNVYALDAKTGGLRWMGRADYQPSARVNGNVVLGDGVVYVPISSNQEFAVSVNPNLPCCTFRGGIVAFDVATGRQLWKTYLIDEPLRELGVNYNGVKRYGPSGAAVWSVPTVDKKRNVLYVSTSNQYTEPRVLASDAIIALDLTTGKRRWGHSFVPEEFSEGDIWNGGCEAVGIIGATQHTCPPMNPDLEGDREFGSPVVLKTLADGRDVLYAGSKDGMLYALDPDRDGAVIWNIRLSSMSPGRGPILGGIEHGVAVDDKQIYVPIADMNPLEQTSAGNMFAVNIKSGKVVWEQPAPSDTCKDKHFLCNNANMAAPTLAGGYLFSGSSDGFLRVYDTNNGRVVWAYDTARKYIGINGVTGVGGAINRNGPTIVNGMLYQNSGYGHLLTGMPGHVLLAFEIPDAR